MHFHFCTANITEGGKLTLAEMFSWFAAGLQEAGHTVSLSETFLDDRAINVLWEHFPPAIADLIVTSGVRYGIVASEVPDGSGFNWRREPEWVARWNGFAKVAANAEFIWATVLRGVPFYSQFAPTRYVELGYTPRLEVQNTKKIKPVYDFCFYGLRTPYREKVFKELTRHATVIWPTEFLNEMQVNELLLSSRVCLNFKQSEVWPITSTTRLGKILHAKRWAATEWIPDDTEPSQLFGKCPKDVPYPEYCLNLITPDLEERSIAAFERYKAQIPMKDIMLQAANLAKSDSQKGKEKWVPFPLPPQLLERPHGWSIVKYDNVYFAIAIEAGAVSLERDFKLVSELQRAGLVLTAKSLKGLKSKISNHRVRQLCRRLTLLDFFFGEPTSSFSRNRKSPFRVEKYYDWDIVKFRNHYFGISGTVGKIFLEREPGRLERLVQSGLVKKSKSLDRLRARIFATKARSRIKRQFLNMSQERV